MTDPVITPGPWDITPDAKFPADMRVHSKQGTAIAKVYGQDALPHMAHARAIAALPAMIEALMPFAEGVADVSGTAVILEGETAAEAVANVRSALKLAGIEI